tara:strand:- start:5669 stop:6022 length:354 start_codon:yes stop_codon:yes gene_type:complete
VIGKRVDTVRVRVHRLFVKRFLNAIFVMVAAVAYGAPTLPKGMPEGAVTRWEVRSGTVHGETDDFGYYVARNEVNMHDLHATILLLGLDHERLTYHYGGRDFRLTDVSGNVVKEILA